MQSRSVLRVAACVSVKIPEKCELHGFPAASASAVVGAVAGISAWQVAIDGVIAVAGRIRCNLCTNFRQNGRCGTTAGRCRGVDHVTLVSCVGTNEQAIQSVVFIGGFGIVGPVEIHIPCLEPRDLVGREGEVAPTGSPKNVLGNGGGHNITAVKGHQGTSSAAAVAMRIVAASPVNAKHWRLTGRRKILAALPEGQYRQTERSCEQTPLLHLVNLLVMSSMVEHRILRVISGASRIPQCYRVYHNLQSSRTPNLLLVPMGGRPYKRMAVRK